MANSIIDDMLKNQIPNKEKKSGSKVVIVIMLLLIIVALIAGGVIWYLKSQNKMTPKQAFIYYLEKENVESILNLEKINSLNNRLQKEPSEANTELTGDLSSGLFNSKIDLSEMKVTIDSKKIPEEYKSLFDIVIKYKDNDIISFSALSDGDIFGLISEDVVVKYVGAKYSNLGNVLSRIFESDEFNNFDFSNLKDKQLVLPQISSQMLAKYIEVINQKVPDNSFSSKAVTLDRNSGKIDVTEYSMKLTESQTIELVDQLLKTLQADDDLFNTILSFFKYSEDRIETREMLKLWIEQFITSLYDQTPDDSKIYALKVYGKEDSTYRVTIDLYNEASINIDFDYSDKTNSMNITLLENKTNDGVSIDFEKTVSDVTEKLDITFNVIEDSDIIGKFNIISNLVQSRKFIHIKK